MNELLIQFFIFFSSLVVLFFGADFALDGAEKVGKKIGIPPIAIGLLLVGFGTSLPEFFVSHLALLGGKPEIAFGNVIGSNLSNILLILGIASLLIPLKMEGLVLKKQLVFHFVMTMAMGMVFYFYQLDYYFFIGSSIIFVAYLYFTLKTSKDSCEKYDCSEFKTIHIVKMILGFIMLYLGGDWLVNSTGSLCRIMGVSEFVVSVVLLAFGTSFPELVTVLIAIKKKKDTNLIVGNIIGSNIFNFILILGSAGLYQIVPKNNYIFEFIVLICLGLIFIIVNKRRKRLSILFGAFCLLSYSSLILYWIKFAS